MPCPHCNGDRATWVDEKDILCRDCNKVSAAALWGTLVGMKRKRTPYNLGQHGGKKKAQKKFKTSGKTHESEHVIGYEVFGEGEQRGKSSFARKIENIAPAYQEDYDSHRGHIGTGSWKDYHGTGEGSDDYRRMQRRLVKSLNVGAAVQLNQLYYAFQKEFHSRSNAKSLEKGDRSFEEMVENFPPVPIQFQGDWRLLPVSDSEKAEMSLSRLTARKGVFPSKKEELAKMKTFGIIPGGVESLKTGPSKTCELDPYGIPKDGNCLFHSIWDRMNHAGMSVGFTTNDDLRRQAVAFLREDPDIQSLGVAGTQYCLTMQMPGTWGGELEALALAYVWGISITVIGPAYTITYNPGRWKQITIHYNGVNHYSVGPFT